MVKLVLFSSRFCTLAPAEIVTGIRPLSLAGPTTSAICELSSGRATRPCNLTRAPLGKASAMLFCAMARDVYEKIARVFTLTPGETSGTHASPTHGPGTESFMPALITATPTTQNHPAETPEQDM